MILAPAAAVAIVAGLAFGPGERADAASIRFAVKGDWGAGTSAQVAVTRRICAESRRAPFRFVLTTGDNFYAPDGRATRANFLRPERCLRRAAIRYRPAWGNHDLGGDATARVLGAPARWYRFRAGPVGVIVLDGNRAGHGRQLAFLRRALHGFRRRPIVVAFHQPAYTVGLHAPGATQQRLWAPLFRRHRVALVLQGHNHAYERIVRGGVVYVTTGGGGAPVYPCVRRDPGLVTCRPEHHFLAVRAGPRALTVRAIGVRGQTLDRFRVTRASAR